ncbi:putative methyltransferase DDB_G0268948 [Punica granatum]|uniref:Methyltransferase type 11 domain-containing protein n=2 Tax=Punica granatum TaxID=22663 RepID=A0A218Y350_PUNGR|nr:putative methyltransferase DDB_G0268948 [Punica granatum]OWM91478.1 hypothetical protein CDL15_Pgr017396 [Punica granatum]PKI79439.1 hypothetical protein CRG98_000186 [Punica granatum]
MAGNLSDKQAEVYAKTRPTYPRELYEKLAALTPGHALAWDVGTGNGQAAIGVAQHYERVIATDVSESQLKHAMPHPRVQYIHTPLSLSDEELVTMLGGKNSIDLITVAQAVHWFDLPKFYSLVDRLLRKPGGLVAVWAYQGFKVSPTFDPILKRFIDTVMPYCNPNSQYVFNQYKTLPFPFESVGLGSEGNPYMMELHKEISFNGLVQLLKSVPAVTTAKEHGIDLLSKEVMEEFERDWGGPTLVKSVVCEIFMLTGRARM